MSAARRFVGVFGGAVLSSLAAGASGAEPSAALPQISIQPADGTLMIRATAMGVSAVTVSGEVAIDRRGRSGSVTTRQGRTMSLSAGESGDIANVSVSFQPGDEINIDLVLSENGVVIATASVKTAAKTPE